MPSDLLSLRKAVVEANDVLKMYKLCKLAGSRELGWVCQGREWAYRQDGVSECTKHKRQH